jgi:hypothetical protein
MTKRPLITGGFSLLFDTHGLDAPHGPSGQPGADALPSTRSNEKLKAIFRLSCD